MKKLKFLLLSLLTPLFIGVSFADSLDLTTFDFVWNYWKSYVDWSNTNNTYNPWITLAVNKLYCIDIKSFTCKYPSAWGWSSCSYNVDLHLTTPNSVISYFFTSSLTITRDSSISLSSNVWSVWCFMSDSVWFDTIAQLPDYVSFNFDLYSKDVFSVGVSDCSQDPNYLQCLDRVNELNWQVWTLSWSLQTCNSDLATCTNSCDVSVSQCRESLSWCQSDLTNMTNYNDSLNSQLQECLANSPIPDTPCEWTWCDEIISWTNTMFSMFRSVEDMMYSLPLSNNIYLPRWYRWYVDSWVVAIWEIEKKKIVIDDDSFNEINKSYYKVFAWLIFLFLTALFTYYLKKFITKFFIPKS